MKLPEAVQADVAKRIMSDYVFAKQARDVLTQDWEKARKQVECEFTELASQHNKRAPVRLTKFYVPTTLKMWHRTISEFVHHYFPEGELNLVEVQAHKNAELDAMAAKMTDEILHAKVELGIHSQLRRALMDSYDTGLVEGTGVVKAGWDYSGQRETNRPTVTHLPGEHCCWDPWAIIPDQIRFFCHELWLTEDELWSRVGQQAYNREAVRKMLTTSGEEEPVDDAWRNTQTAGTSSVRRFKIIEYWGPQQLYSDQHARQLLEAGQPAPMTDIVATIHRDNHVLRLDANPYAALTRDPQPFAKLPFFFITPLPRRNSTRGWSLVLWIRESQREINTTRTQRRRAIDREMMGRTYYDVNLMMDVKKAQAARYGGYVPVDGDPRAAVYDQQFMTSTQNMTQEEGIMQREVDEITGVNDMRLGVRTPGDATATEINARSAQGNANQDALLLNADAGISELMGFFVECAIEFTTAEEAQQILGTLETPPRPSAILKRDYRLQVKAGASAATKAQKQRDLEYMLEHLARMTAVAPEIAVPAMKMILAKLAPMLGCPDVGRLFDEIDAALQGQVQGAGQQPNGPSSGGQMAMTQQGRLGSRQEGPMALGMVG